MRTLLLLRVYVSRCLALSPSVWVCVPETRQHVVHRKLIYVKSYAAAAKPSQANCASVLNIMRHWLVHEKLPYGVNSLAGAVLVARLLCWLFAPGLSKSNKLTLGQGTWTTFWRHATCNMQHATFSWQHAAHNFATLCGTGVKNLTCILLQTPHYTMPLYLPSHVGAA